MKAVLLAAGRSLRMQPIPDKNFLKFLGKPLIQHQLESLIQASFREILIIGASHNMTLLRSLISKNNFKKAKITLREQKELELGMAGALLTSASWIKNEPFIVVSSNDVIDESVYELIKKNIRKDEGLLLAYKVKNYFPGGYLKVNPKGTIAAIIEKPGQGHEPSKLVNIVLHYHPYPKELLGALQSVSSERDDRYEKALQLLFDKKIIYRAVPYAGFWQPIKYPWHVISLMNRYISQIEERFPHGRIGGKKAEVAKTATLKGTDVYLEDGVKILDNAVIVGPAYIGKNTVIATNALVRGSHIGGNCVIGFGSEVARSYIGDNVWMHTNYVGDSIIGNNVSFGAGTVTGNLRFDEQNVSVSIKGERIDSGMNKLGLITGDNIRTGINTSFMPGVKIGSNTCIGAGLTITGDIPENSFVTGESRLKIYENRVKINPRV